jgi:hypothetical protein
MSYISSANLHNVNINSCLKNMCRVKKLENRIELNKKTADCFLLVLQGESKAKLVGVFVQTSRVNRTTNGELDTRAKQLSVSKNMPTISNLPNHTLCYFQYTLPESEDTRVGDLSLDESSSIKLILGTDLQGDGVGAFGVPDGLTTSLDIGAHTVEVGSREDGQRVGGMHGDSVLGSTVAKSSVVAGNLAIQNIISNFTTSEESLMADDGVDVEVGL